MSAAIVPNPIFNQALTFPKAGGKKREFVTQIMPQTPKTQKENNNKGFWNKLGKLWNQIKVWFFGTKPSKTTTNTADVQKEHIHSKGCCSPIKSNKSVTNHQSTKSNRSRTHHVHSGNCCSTSPPKTLTRSILSRSTAARSINFNRGNNNGSIKQESKKLLADHGFLKVGQDLGQLLKKRRQKQKATTSKTNEDHKKINQVPEIKNKKETQTLPKSEIKEKTKVTEKPQEKTDKPKVHKKKTKQIDRVPEIKNKKEAKTPAKSEIKEKAKVTEKPQEKTDKPKVHKKKTKQPPEQPVEAKSSKLKNSTPKKVSSQDKKETS